MYALKKAVFPHGNTAFLGLRFSEKQQHGTDGGEDSAGRAGDGVDLAGCRIVLFYKVIDPCAKNTDDETDNFDCHYFTIL